MNDDNIKMLNEIINIVMRYSVSEKPPQKKQQETASPEPEAAEVQLHEGE